MAIYLISEPVSMILIGIGLMSLSRLERIFLKNPIRHKPHNLLVKAVLSTLFPVSVLVIILALYRL